MAVPPPNWGGGTASLTSGSLNTPVSIELPEQETLRSQTARTAPSRASLFSLRVSSVNRMMPDRSFANPRVPWRGFFQSRRDRRQMRKPLLMFALGPWLGAATTYLIAMARPPGLSHASMRLAGVTVWIMFWWMSQALPLGVTALLPLCAFPALGIMKDTDVVKNYSTPLMWLFFGGFQLAFAIERTGLHTRIAMAIINRMGTQVSHILLGMMIAVALLSMILSNTSTTIMMLPVAEAVIAAIEKDALVAPVEVPFLLGIAYAASCGGIATIIGTPPNGAMVRFAKSLAGLNISFSQWLLFAFPLSALMVGALWWYFVRLWKVPREELPPEHPIFAELAKDRGPLSQAEKYVGFVFCATGAAWATSQLVQQAMRDAGLDNAEEYWGDDTISIMMVFALFIIKAKDGDGESKPLMDWQSLLRTPWNVLFLFGGGFALGDAFNSTGLSDFIGNWFGRAPLPNWLLMLLVVLAVTFLTEATSNMATANVLLPILASASRSLGRGELYLMLPATLAASCAFMMPVATPPNAIVFGTGRIRLKEMCQTGFALNVFFAVLITIWCQTWGRVIFPM